MVWFVWFVWFGFLVGVHFLSIFLKSLQQFFQQISARNQAACLGVGVPAYPGILRHSGTSFTVLIKFSWFASFFLHHLCPTLEIQFCCISPSGQALPADAVFVKGQDLKVDESAVTGETDVMRKKMDTDPFFISGTNILEGCHTLVCAVLIL